MGTRCAGSISVPLLCEESGEIDGPVDEPICCGLGVGEDSCYSTARSLLRGKADLSVGVREERRQPARLGFPEPRKRGAKYPAAQLESEHGDSQAAKPQLGNSTGQSQKCGECKFSL